MEGRQDNQHFGVPTTTNGRPSLLRGSDLVETARAGTMSLGRFAILLTNFYYVDPCHQEGAIAVADVSVCRFAAPYGLTSPKYLYEIHEVRMNS